MTNDVQEWLTANGYEQFVDVFAENEVDWNILLELSNEDLKDLSVAKLGDRKKLLAAIAKLSETALQDSTNEVQTTSSNTSISNATVSLNPDAEYRQLTVMFCDLVGSTELSRQIDAEDLRKIIRSYQTACVNAVEPLGGFVARFMGDGVVVYFGYPIADENDPERAVAAGLAVIETCSRSISASVRVGIATGRVIVGDLLHNGPAAERVVVGETPNLAARLQTLAQPDSVVVSDTTRRLAGGGFQFTDLGPHSLKGFDTAITAWEVVGVRQTESRFESTRGPLIPLVGRKTEIMLLADRWQLACSGEGQAVYVSGDAGIGKSRLIEGLRHEVAASKHLALRYQCSPHHTTSALYPIILQLQRAAQLAADDKTDTKLDKLEALLQIYGNTSTQDAQFLAHLLSIPFEARYGALNQSPQEIKAQTFETLITLVLSLSERESILFVVEDTHWIDPASDEFLGMLIGRIQQARVLLVVTHRPTWQPNLHGYNNISSLRLNRLSKVHCETIVRAMVDETLTDDVVRSIVSRTDGIPLFIEELTKSLVEGGLTLKDADIPATLQASLLARIDRLEPQAKELIQTSAVIGREFSLELLKAVASPDHPLSDELEQLVQSELLFEAGTATGKRYSFKHALVQDSVYDSMLSETRAAQHLKIATALVNDFHETVDAAPELAAYHFTEAGSFDQAIAYWHQAGKRSAGRSADAESVAQLTQAVSILESIEKSPERLQQDLDLHIDLTGPLIAIGGYSSVDMEKNTQRALDLAEHVGETNRIFPILYGRFVFHLHTGHVNRACNMADEFLQLATRTKDPETKAQGHRLYGFALINAGQPAEADRHLQQAVTYRTPPNGGSQPSYYGQDVEATANVIAAWARLHRGYPEQAIDLFDRAIVRARKLDHANTLGVVLFHGGNMFVTLKQAHRVKECLQELKSLNEKYDLILWQTAESLILPGLMSLNSMHEGVIEAVSPALQIYTETLRMNLHTPFVLSHAANAHLGLQQWDGAISEANRALSVSKTTGGFIEDPNILRILAKAKYLKEGNNKYVEEGFTAALHCAKEMKTKWYELRISKDYSEYLLDTGEEQKAVAILKPLFESFSEGHEMPDLLDAKALLDKLPIAKQSA